MAVICDIDDEAVVNLPRDRCAASNLHRGRRQMADRVFPLAKAVGDIEVVVIRDAVFTKEFGGPRVKEELEVR
jgi:hypothetical protein